MAKWTYFHSLDPFIIQLTDNFGIRWYSMAYVTGFLMSYILINQWLIKTKTTNMSKKQTMDFVMWVAIGVILGGRLGYAFFYNPSILFEFDSHFPYWELVKIYHGGLSSHGGIVGLIAATLLYARSQKLSGLHCLDMTVLGASLGIFFGRIANFINGELFGRIINKNVLFAVQFPKETLNWISNKNIEYLKELEGAVTAAQIKGIDGNTWQNLVYQFETTDSVKGQIYYVIYHLIKACENGKREVIESLKLVLSYRHPSQLYQAFLEGLLPFLVVWWLWRRTPLKAGFISGLWLVSYSVMRIFGEQFRMPDIELGFRALGLTRGQWLSVTMMIFIVPYFILVLKNKNLPKFGGWAQKKDQQ